MRIYGVRTYTARKNIRIFRDDELPYSLRSSDGGFSNVRNVSLAKTEKKLNSFRADCRSGVSGKNARNRNGRA